MVSGDDSRDVTARLDAALSALESAVARVAGADQARTDLVDSLAVMDDDRQRLAADLDAALFRAKTLEAANEAVATRLEKLGERLGRFGETHTGSATP